VALGFQSTDTFFYPECNLYYTRCYELDNFRNTVDSKVHTHNGILEAAAEIIIFSLGLDNRQSQRRHPQRTTLTIMSPVSSIARNVS